MIFFFCPVIFFPLIEFFFLNSSPLQLIKNQTQLLVHFKHVIEKNTNFMQMLLISVFRFQFQLS